MHAPRPAVALAIAATLLTGCSAIADALPKGGPIAQSLAEDYARLSSGASVAPVAVVSSRLSTYGAERPGGRAAKPETRVWAVVLSGMFFPAASCFLQIVVPGYGASPLPPPPANSCPAPSPRERVRLDANWGTFLESIPGG